jgi:hypothetical protein
VPSVPEGRKGRAVAGLRQPGVLSKISRERRQELPGTWTWWVRRVEEISTLLLGPSGLLRVFVARLRKRSSQ